METSDRIRIRMTVHWFLPTIYIRRMYGLNRIYAVYGPYLQVVFNSQQQQSFLLCLVNFLFSRLFLPSSSFASFIY